MKWTFTNSHVFSKFLEKRKVRNVQSMHTYMNLQQCCQLCPKEICQFWWHFWLKNEQFLDILFSFQVSSLSDWWWTCILYGGLLTSTYSCKEKIVSNASSTIVNFNIHTASWALLVSITLNFQALHYYQILTTKSQILFGMHFS